MKESIADLENPDKDCSYTPDTLLADIDSFVDTFHKNFAWYNDPFGTVVFPAYPRCNLILSVSVLPPFSLPWRTY